MGNGRISRLRSFAARAFGLLTPRKSDGDFDQEVQAHLQLLVDRFVAQGMSRKDAAAAARIARSGLGVPVVQVLAGQYMADIVGGSGRLRAGGQGEDRHGQQDRGEDRIEQKDSHAGEAQRAHRQ